MTPRRRTWIAALALAVVVVAAAVAWWRRSVVDPAFVVDVRRGSLTTELTVSGTLRPNESITYRSPVAGRELEIVSMVAEGSRVKEGDVLMQLDTTELERDLVRQRQDFRQLRLDLQVAHAERQEAEAALTMANEGDGALSVEEARAALRLAGKKRDRLQQEYDELKPLLDRGYITRDELARTASALEEADQELALVRKRSEIVETLTHPRETRRATLQLAQKNAELENVVGRLQEAEARLAQLTSLVEACRITARRPGLVVYEQLLSAIPRRKVRVGDRVTASQGILTIPEVSRMTVDASVTEADVHRVKAGQSVRVRLEAFPELRLTGRVTRVGTVATASLERPMDDKRFETTIELDPTASDLRPEMSARADIMISRKDDVLLVPVAAVTDFGGDASVLVAGFGGVSVRRIEPGDSNGEVVEVKAGLREGERIVLTGPPTRQGPGQPAPAQMENAWFGGAGAGQLR